MKGTETEFRKENTMFEERMTRRDALKKAAYITPVILTFLAAPSFASGGSGRDERHEEDERDGKRGGGGGDGGGNGKRGGRWLWDHERDQRRHKKQFGWWD
jgi:hypothetical protein